MKPIGKVGSCFSMRSSLLNRFLGFSLLLVGLIFFLAVLYPYSKLWGKGEVEFDSPVVGAAEESGLLPWPVFSRLKEPSPSSVSQAFLSVEKLGIKKAPVRLDVLVDNLRPTYLSSLVAGLAHLQGTVYPGEKGNSVVFGHSALPYLYNPRNFQTIFTRIDELKFGDEIVVEIGSKLLRFRVEKGGLLSEKADLNDLFSRKPRLTLLTCYPPGFKTQRYVVRAILET